MNFKLCEIAKLSSSRRPSSIVASVCVCGEYGVGCFRDSMKQEWGLEDLNEDEIPLNEKAQQYVPK